MKLQSFYTKILVLFLLSTSHLVMSQDLGKYQDNTMIAVPTLGNTTTGNLSFSTLCSDFNVKEGKVWLKIDLGEQYQLGSSTAGIPFDVNVNLDLSFVTSGGTNPKINFDLNLDNKKPESIVYIDLNQYVDAANTSTGLTYLTESITALSATINNAVDNTATVDLQANLRIGLYYEVNYGIDVATNQVSLISRTINASNKVVTFDWDDTCEAPNYQFQLLRLYNKDNAFLTSERNIKTNVDWSKALSFQTYSAATELQVTIGEGQGFYVWRVRPIGTFNENGLGNNDNWGAWNASNYSLSVNDEFIDTTINVESFFFEDADDDKNYQYSRVFTEGNKISEQVTYATTLNQIKQTQRYFSSKDYKIVSQTVLDKSGRPTLTTLPVPVEGEKISEYKNNFVTTNQELYRAKHFDELSNYTQPSVIDATGAFGYYSGLNGDKRIPDAEGYPFTRVIFSNDGTDRVVEKSGVGMAHMIGDQASGQGRTVKTLYGTPTEDELVALFGDEAPAPENTSKVITIDPNNTKSVAYITKDGNTIATGLTFSDDATILEKIGTGPTISGKTDNITNNIRTIDGFKSSKRVTILEDNTEINLSYTIAKPVLLGLCNNLEIDLDYKLQIEVFDIETGAVVHEVVEESLTTYLASPSDTEITIDFGMVSLNAGSYYVQKTLIPADDVTAKLVSSTENIRRLIEPYFDWLTTALNEIDCEEEMQTLYEDIFFYGRRIYEGEIGTNLGLAENGGVLDFPSGLSVTYLSKDLSNPDAPDEFLDYYSNRKEEYGINILYYDSGGDLQTIDYASVTALGNITPIEVQFITPCCVFDIPIVFTPPFRKPSAEALEAYKNDVVADSQLNNSNDYYTGINVVKPNYEFLTKTEDNFQYTQTVDGLGNVSVTLDKKDAYPMDFEGYAISMLYECKSTADATYTVEAAAETVYKSMRGWHKPGLLNQMIYHMSTDNHGPNGCKNRVDGTGGIVDPEANPTVTAPIDDYHVCDVPDNPVYLNGAQYSISELAECWESIVIEMVNKLCVEGIQADIDQESNVSDNVDDQDSKINDAHFKKNIKNFIVRWISKRKLRRKIRRQSIGTEEGIEEEVAKLSGNLVKSFLDCTGYAFADVLDPTTPANNFADLDEDFNTNQDDGEYNKERLLEDVSTGVGRDWAYFAVRAPKELGDDGYDPNNLDEDYIDPSTDTDPLNPTKNILRDLFPNIQDPVYAYKYYTYRAGDFPDLEAQNCFRDPNICKDPITGEDVPCCGGTLAEPVPCNFCGIGYINCPYTREDWSCDQRFTFYNLIKTYENVPQEPGVILECSNYYEGTDYVNNPFVDIYLATEDFLNDPDASPASAFDDLLFKSPYNTQIPKDAFYGIPYLSRELVEQYIETYKGDVNAFDRLKAEEVPVVLTDINGNTQTTGVSIIENDAYAMKLECNENCDERRSEFREELIKSFTDRCYEIGECKITPNDNIIPIADIDEMVEKIVAQCKQQCNISTYSCVDESCRSTTKSIFEFGATPQESSDFNTSYIDYGVSGPVVTSLTNRSNQTLMVNGVVNGTVTDTGILATVSNVSVTGLLEKYSYNFTPTASIWDMRRSLTYAEYSRWVQAMEWEIELNIPSKCDDLGNYNTSLTYDVDGFPLGTVYVQNEDGMWVIQDVSLIRDAMTKTPYITRTDPNNPGDTFLDRDRYIKTKNAPASTSDASLTEPVKSPKVGIKHTVNN